MSLVDIHNPDLERFPRFAEALKRARRWPSLSRATRSTFLSIGGMEVGPLAPVNLFINYWWNDARPVQAIPTTRCSMPFMRSKHSRPISARFGAWCSIITFCGTNGDPVEHLPERARGMLGEATGEQLMRMQATLRHLLSRV